MPLGVLQLQLQYKPIQSHSRSIDIIVLLLRNGRGVTALATPRFFCQGRSVLSSDTHAAKPSQSCLQNAAVLVTCLAALCTVSPGFWTAWRVPCVLGSTGRASSSSSSPSFCSACFVAFSPNGPRHWSQRPPPSQLPPPMAPTSTLRPSPRLYGAPPLPGCMRQASMPLRAMPPSHPPRPHAEGWCRSRPRSRLAAFQRSGRLRYYWDRHRYP
jgi:hypothetical protein